MTPARPAPGMILRALAVVLVTLALLFIACAPGNEATPTGTATPEATETVVPPPIDILPTVTETPTPAPTATPLPPAAASALWTFDLARGRPIPLYEGDAQLSSEVDASGNAVTTTIVDGDARTAVRFALDGERIEEHDGRSLIITSPSGEARFYLEVTDPENPGLVLEYRGDEVRLEGTRPRVGVSFSPSGDRLLTLSERPGAAAGEVVRTYSVHRTVDGRLLMQFEHRARIDVPSEAFWSPSGRYVADRGLEGLFVRDTVSGRAWRLGPDGDPRWSSGSDRLLVITDLDRLSVVNVPDLDGIDLGPIERGGVAYFDRSGQVAVVTTYEDPDAGSGGSTQAFDVDTGVVLATWIGLDASGIADLGLEPVVRVDGAIAGVFIAQTGCGDGFVVVHPGVDDGSGRCIEGANPAWSPNGQLLVFARGRQIIALSPATDSERVLVRGTPPADVDGGPLLRWSPDGSWILIQWPWQPALDALPS